MHSIRTSSTTLLDNMAVSLTNLGILIFNADRTWTLVPPIAIASIMMQESTCNKDTVGGGGEQGLMQITKDKCGGAPGGNCKDPVSSSPSVWFRVIHTAL